MTNTIVTSTCNVALIGPSGYATDDGAVARGIARLQSQGCKVLTYVEPEARYQRFAATDAERLAALHDAVSDADVHLVMALGGGYGMTRLLPDIDYQLLADSGKLLVGHSDFTALQLALYAKTGAISFAGPMLCDDYTHKPGSEWTYHHFWQTLTQPVFTVEFPTSHDLECQEEGKLWGGNLSMLTHLLGTPYFPAIRTLRNGLLFVEDINEHPYRIERMLLQLLQAGVLQQQKALLLGSFSSYRLTDYDNGYDMDTMIQYVRSQLPIPIISGLPFGHLPDKLTLPFGANARLQVSEGQAQLTISGHPLLPVTRSA